MLIEEVLDAYTADPHGKPKLIIANTIKGRGVPSLENKPASHFSHLDDQQVKIAMDLIEAEKKALKSRGA